MTQCPAIRSGAVTKVTGGALRIAPTKSSGHNASRRKEAASGHQSEGMSRIICPIPCS
jgi:hypothetical protein